MNGEVCLPGKGPWKTLACALLLVVPTAASGRDALDSGAGGRFPTSLRIARWDPHIEEASARFGVPQDWIRRVMRAESGGRTTIDGVPITSLAGAMGLMQLMPGTWAEMRRRHRLGTDPHDPRDNVLAGTAYLRAMYDRFGYPGLFAAYNAGPARYAEHLSTGRRLPSETLAYVAAIAGRPPERPPRGPAAIFVAPAAGGEALSRQDQDGLFVRLNAEFSAPQ